MYNINAPVGQNNYCGGIQYPPQSFVPTNGNMLSISGQGYNGGYYTNNYTAYNPYLLQQQREREEAQRLQNLRTQSDMMKRMSKRVNKACGTEISDERLKELYDPMEIRTSKEDLELMNIIRLSQIDAYNTANNLSYQDPYYLSMTKIQEEQQKKFRPDMDLKEFFEEAGGILLDSIKEEAMNDRNRVDRLYNKSEYQKLIDSRSSGGTGIRSLLPDINIDDMEIQLPQHLKNEYQERKRLFMEKLINRGGNSNG